MILPKRAHRPTATFTAVVLMLVLALIAMGCGSDDRFVSSGTTAEQATVVPTTAPATTVTTPTAAAQLQPFISLAAAADRDLAEAAQRINAAATEETITYDERTVALLNGISIGALADALPAGMPAELEQAGLLVYSDILSRLASMSIWCLSEEGTRPRVEYIDAQCFVHGAPAATRFDGDLAALVSAADHTPAFVVAAPDSRTAEALAARIETIDLQNVGCGGVGGYSATEPITVIWEPSPGFEDSPDWEGTVDGIRFFGIHDAETGWTIRMLAC